MKHPERRHAFGFESQDFASVGKPLIPGNVEKLTTMAIHPFMFFLAVHTLKYSTFHLFILTFILVYVNYNRLPKEDIS